MVKFLCKKCDLDGKFALQRAGFTSKALDATLASLSPNDKLTNDTQPGPL